VIKLEKTPVFLLSQLGWTKDNVDKLVTAPDDATLKITITEDYAPSLVYALHLSCWLGCRFQTGEGT